MNIVSLLDTHLSCRPNHPAIIDYHNGSDRTVTFANLVSWSAAIKESLLQHGLKKGDRVLIAHPVSAEFYAVLLALFSADMVAMIVDPGADDAHIERCFLVARPNAIVLSPLSTLLLLKLPVLRSIKHKLVVGNCLPFLHRLPGWAHCPRRDQEANAHASSSMDRLSCVSPSPAGQIHDVPALLTFTSGSTGAPKAILRTQRFLEAQHHSCAAITKATAETVQLTVLPVFVLSNLLAGATSVLPLPQPKISGRNHLFKKSITQIERLNINSILASPAFVRGLSRCAGQEKLKLKGVRSIFTGGGPIFPTTFTMARSSFPKAAFTAVYGSSEAEPIAALNYSETDSSVAEVLKSGRGLLAGNFVSSITARIIKPLPVRLEDNHGFEIDDLVVAPGETGEIIVSGDHVVEAYLDDRNPETKILVNGRIWHRTGDAGYVDRDNQLWLLGRLSARLEDKNGVLFPFEVETALDATGIDTTAAVVPFRGARYLVVESPRGVTSELAEKLADLRKRFKITKVVPVHKIPVDRRHLTKIDYGKIAEIVMVQAQRV